MLDGFLFFLMKGFVEHCRERCLKLHVLVFQWMMEAELVGMEAEASEAVVGGAVFLIAHDGVSEVLCMDADLVFSSCLQVEVDE